jgi:hypothetical protein
MTRLSNATDSTLPDLTSLPRRYADPPALWAIVAVGSLTIHALLLLGMRWFNVQVSLSQPKTDTVLVEIIDVAPQAADSTPTLGTTAASPENAPSPPTQATAVPDIATPNIEVQRQPVDRPSSAAIAPPHLDTNSGSTATPIPQTTPTSSSRPPVNLTPQPAIPSPSPSSSGNPGSGDLPSDGSGSPGSSSNPGSASDHSSPPVAPGAGTPLNPPGQTGDNLPTASVDRQATPSSYTASVLSVGPIPQSENPTDIQEQIAQPKALRQDFTSDPSGSGAATCLPEPAILPYLGQTVELRAEIQTIDSASGRVSHTDIRRSSGSDAYDNFAACLLANWEFRPASTQGQSPPFSEVVVQIKIDLNANR